MKTSESFESEISFEGSNSVGSAEDIFGHVTGDWGVVSHDGSEENVRVGIDSFESESFGNGVLILDGVESSTRNEPSVLTMPGTYSLPTEIGSLSDNNRMDRFDDDLGTPRIIWETHKRKIVLFLVPFVGASIAGVGFLFREMNSWRTSALRLEQEVQRLEQEKIEMEASYKSKPAWDSASEENPDLFTIVDNCWVKAKADIKLGACGEETQESVKDFAKRAWENWGAFWNDSLSTDAAAMLGAVGAVGHAINKAATSHDDSTNTRAKRRKRRRETLNDATSFVSSFPLAFGEAISDASKSISSKVSSLVDSLDEVESAADAKVRQASEALSEALDAASEAMTFELKELSEDPLKYFASAVQGASKTAKPERVTMQGLFNAADAVTSASKTVSESTGEVVSVVMTEIMDDAFSYFEYETETAQD